MRAEISLGIESIPLAVTIAVALFSVTRSKTEILSNEAEFIIGGPCGDPTLR